MNKEYQNSGIDWIGEIPKSWHISRVGAIFDHINKKNIYREETNILSLMKDIGVIPYSEKGDVGNKASDDIERYFLVEPNDIVMNSMNVIIGSVGKSKYKGCLSQVYHVLRTKNYRMDCVNYYNYLFATRQFQKKLVGYGNGILEHRMRIPMSKLKIVELPKPPNYVQKTIANFLDEKTSKVEELIKIQETAIERLEEYKQSVITEAVTKGLNPNALMKDSEIYNIGLIPKEWDVVKLQRMMKVQNGKPCEWVENGYPVYGSGGIFGYTNDYLYLGPSVLLGRKGTIDKPNFVDKPFWTVDTSFYTIIHEDNYPKYCYYIAKSIIDYKLYVYGSAVPSMTQSILHNIYIVKPSYSEQKTIATFLDKKIEEMNQLLQMKKDKIKKLNEYKKSLIYEAVTGKIELTI